MKPNFITQMKAEIALKMELKYAALYQAKMRMTLQLAQDAAMIAANEILHMGPGRAKEFAAEMRDVVNEIADVMLADQKDDEKFAYTRVVVDRRLKKICGENFVPGRNAMGKNKRRVVLLVTPQTAYNLQRLADMDKTSPGRVVDKLVRDRMIELREAVKHG